MRPFGLMLCAVAAMSAVELADAAEADPQALVLYLSGEQGVQLLRQAGHEALLESDRSGDPMITARGAGQNYRIYFYGCDRGAVPIVCTELQFSAEFMAQPDLTLEMVNAYNTQARYVQAYLTADKQLRLDMSVSLTGGITTAAFQRQLQIWSAWLGQFDADMYRPEPAAAP